MARGTAHGLWGLMFCRRRLGFWLGAACVLALLLLSSHSSALIDLTIFGPKRYDRLKGKPTIYTDTFERCEPSSQALLKVTNGDSKKTRIKAARIYINGAKIASEKDFKQKVPIFEKLITVREHNELKIILKSGHHGYLDKLAKYQAKKAEFEQELARLQELRSGLSSETSVLSVAKIEGLLREVHEIKKSLDEHESSLAGMSWGLDDDSEDEAEPQSDDEDEIDSGWIGKEREKLEKHREEVKDTIKETEKARDALDMATKKKGKEISSVPSESSVAKKKDALKELAKLLKDLDRALEKALARLEDIEEKIEKIKKKGPSFLIIEIIGKGCDDTPPVISAPEPADGALLNTATPKISAQYADEYKGSGIDTKTVRMTVDGTDVTQSASITATGISYTPSSSLPEGQHTVTVDVADRAHNAASLTWHFTTDTIAPVVRITSPQNGQYLKTSTIAVSGTLDDSTATVTVNNQPAENTGTGFTLANLMLTEGENTISVEAKDPAGNIGRDSIKITLDTVPPAVNVTTPRADDFVKTPKITVSGTVTELHPAGLWINNTPVQLSGGSFSSGVGLIEGPNTVTVRATDLATNETTTTVPVTLDTVLPVVTITAPTNGLLTNNPQITVTGTVNEPIISLTINNTPATFTGQGFSIPYTLVEGPNAIAVTATDRATNPGTANVNVKLDTTPPSAPVITQPETPTKVSNMTITGTAEPNATVNIYATTSDTGASRLTGTVIADPGGMFTLGSVTLTEGTNTFTATATDPAGNTSVSSGPIAVVLDTKPPVITVTAPANNTYTNQVNVTVTGSVNEEAALIINGAEVPLDNLNFTHTVTLTSGITSIVLTATDFAGNPATTTVFVTLDQTPPVVTINSPMSGLITNNSQISISGTVNETVTSVTVGTVAAVISGSSFSAASYTLSDGENAIIVTATDRAGNTGSANVQIILDTQIPAVTLSAPGQAAAGAQVSISTGATDNRGLTLIEVSANGTPIWSFTPNSELSASNSIAFTLSPDLAQNSSVALQARAYDVAGNTGSATATVQITSGPTGPGYIQGEVYDDTKGLRLEGATAKILDAEGHGLTQIVTLEDGGYFSELSAGNYVVVLSKAGFTPVERAVSVRPEKNTVAIDARLMQINSQQNLIDVNGGKISAPLSVFSVGSVANIELDVPAGALTEQVDIRLTPISNQGLAGLLPAGWSPIAVVDITTAGSGSQGQGYRVTFEQTAALKVSVVSGPTLSASSSVTLVSYDRNSHQWIVREPGTVSNDAAFVTAPISSTGQYAFVFSDSGSALPATGPLPLDPGVSTLNSALSTPNSLMASGRVVPPAAPPSAGLKAVGEVIISPSAGSAISAVQSGLIVTARVTERFDLFSGEVVAPSEYVQDLVMYKYPCLTGPTLNSELGTPNSGKVGSTFPVTPSREYTITELMLGKVGIEVNLREGEVSTGVMVGAEGARLLDSDGNVLVIPQNGLTRTVPVETKTIAPSTISGVVGSDFTLLRAVELNVTNQILSQTAEISIPAPSGINSALPIVVAKAIEVKGVKKLKLVALARLSGSLVISSAFSANSAVNFPGIASSGLYLFLQAKSPLGFITGTVKDASGNPFPSALVTSSTCSLVDLTGPDGKYLIAGTVAGFTATATDIYKNDQAAANGVIASANQAVTANLVIQVTPPRVVSLTPADNATGIEPNASITITFSEAVDKTTITSANIVLKDASNNAIPGVFSVNPEGTVVTFYPSALLASETRHTLTISRSIRDLQGYFMGQDVTSSFTIKDTTPPPLPPAGSVTGSFPDANGFVTITGTRGSAEPTGTVLIINENSGEIVAVKPESNGSFTGRIMAMLGDEIKVTLMDRAGNQTLITYITFKSDDGKYLVTAKGGIVEGEGGLKLEIPEGALFGPAVVKITPVTEDNLPHPVPAEGKFLAAINIDTGGVKFNKEVKLSAPAPSGMPADAAPFVAEPSELVNPDGTREKVYVIRDSAKVIDGRLTTASWPFDGIWSFGIFSFIYVNVTSEQVGISGYTYRDMDGVPGYNPQTDKPIKNAVIRCPAAYNFIAYSNSTGRYASYGFNTQGVCRSFDVTAINPLTMYRHTAKITVCDAPYFAHNLNFMLADATTTPADTTAPSIGINLQVAPEQDAGNENARFTAGTIPVNTNITVPVSVTDQEMGTTTLTVTYKTPDMTAGVPYPVMLTPPPSPELYIPASADSPAVYKYVYTQSYPSPINGCGSQCFRPDKPGTYTFSVEACDAAGNRSTKSVQVRAVLAGSTPDGVDGPPAIDEIIPADGAREIMITMPVMATFSEPVQNVTSETFQLFVFDYDPNTQQTYANPVPASVYTSIEAGRMRAVLQPKNNLMYGKSYKVVLTTGITDSVPNPSSNDALLPLDHQYEATFTTKVPQVFDLESSFEGAGYGDIALYTHPDGRTFAYVTSNEKGWHAVDVTDPTRPFVTYSQNRSNQVVTWRYRGAAVDPQSGILAITEWIQWMYAGGSQFGYVRFYDIRTNPAAPALIGQERLAEEASGVPDKVALSGNFAFITTLLVGLQVVDIDLSKNYSDDPGSAIVSAFETYSLEECPRPENPAINQCGSPSDIALVKNNLALIPTFSGSLLIVDVSTPRYPSLITAFQPQGYSARRIAAVSEYAYTDESGNNMVVDLAVTSANFAQGNVHTVDVTEPYNPKILGVVKDTAGNIVNDIFAIDITISKTSGLVYASTASAVYVIDIRDPRNPVLLNIISQAPNVEGTMVPLGYSPALVEKEGWVYLANQQKGLRVLDLDPVEIGIADADHEFADVSLPGRDYYPALGTKAVTVWGIVSGEPLDDKWELRVNETVANFLIGGQLDNNGKPINGTPATFRIVPGYREGFATLYIRWNGNENVPWVDKFTIKLQAVKKNATLPLMISVNASEQYSYAFTVRHNGNVKLEEVLNGKAVFVYDETDDMNRWGSYNPCWIIPNIGCSTVSPNTSAPLNADPEEYRRLYYVQEMLNQVVPRKRTLSPPTGTGAYTYTLIDEDGKYDVATSNALAAFKRNFNLSVNTLVGPYPYGNNTQDNTSPIFRKLMKDYGKRQTGPSWLVGGTDTNSWLHKVVDKGTLIKSVRRIPLSNEEVNTDNADVLRNGVAGNTRDDTGLYELYKNVVERFNGSLINLAESYERNANPGNNFGGQPGQWVPREGPAQIKTNYATPLAVAYNYGGRQTVREFNTQVARYRAPSKAELTVPASNAFSQAAQNYITGYRGRIGDPAANETNLVLTTFGVIDGGDKKWTGLYENEYVNNTANHHFYFGHWTGIDCNGLAMHSLRYSEIPDQYASDQLISSQTNMAIPGISLGDVCVQLTGSVCTERQNIHYGPQQATHYPLGWTNVEKFFNDPQGRSLYYWKNTDENVKLIHRGDFVRYTNTHISTVYSDGSSGCVTSNSQTTCTYEIIHAYGGDEDGEYTYPSYEHDLTLSGQIVFARKVIRTWQNIATPTGFGRVKLWE